MAILVCSAAAAVASAFVRLRRARGTEREQVRWFAFGAALALIVTMVQMLVPMNDVLGRIVWCGTLALPAAIGIAILRHRLFDIDLLISRTLLWGLLTAFVVGIYVVVVGVIGARLDGVSGAVPSLVATGLVALLFQPLRARLQRVVDRFVYGERDDPYAAVARLGRRLEATWRFGRHPADDRRDGGAGTETAVRGAHAPPGRRASPWPPPTARPPATRPC